MPPELSAGGDRAAKPAGLLVRDGVVLPERDLHWRFSRSSGPGGQSVNTTDSRVELSYDLTTPSASSALGPDRAARALAALADKLVDGVLTVSAAEHRSQLQNRRTARARLAAVLRAATDPPPRARRATRPSRAAKERRITAKKRRGETKRLRRGQE